MPGPDTFSPDVGQRIAPDGTVTYDFDAHLHARGVDLDAGDTSSPPNDRRIRWLRTSDGGLVADLSAWVDSPTRQSLELRAVDPANGHSTYIAATAGPPLTAVSAVADDTIGRYVIRSDSKSSFVQCAGGNPALIELQWSPPNLNVYVDGALVKTL